MTQPGIEPRSPGPLSIQGLLSNTISFICTQLNCFKYCYLTLVICLYTVKWLTFLFDPYIGPYYHSRSEWTGVMMDHFLRVRQVLDLFNVSYPVSNPELKDNQSTQQSADFNSLDTTFAKNYIYTQSF